MIGSSYIKAYNLLPVLTLHITELQCCDICGEEEAVQTVALGGVSMTDSNGHRYIVTARETSEEGRPLGTYAERNQEQGHEKQGCNRNSEQR